MWSVLLLALLLLAPLPALAAPIQVHNLGEDELHFLTTVDGSVGASSATHTLVDIPNTPWVNSSVIAETNGSAGTADSLNVTWTSNHIKSPHPGDTDPNPNGPVTLSIGFTPTTAGRFTASLGVDLTDPLQTNLTIQHPQVPHFDLFQIRLVIDVSGTLLGGFDIDSYYVQYSAEHCLSPRTLGPNDPFICAEQFPDPGAPPPLLVRGLDCAPADEFCSVEFVEAPATLALLLGAAGLGAVARGWRLRSTLTLAARPRHHRESERGSNRR